MTMTVNRPLLMGAGVVALLALLANIIAMATPNWVTGSILYKTEGIAGGGAFWIHAGLWNYCMMIVGSSQTYSCKSNASVHNAQLDTIRAMAILAMLCGLVTVIVAGALLFAERVAGVGMRMPDLSMQRNAGVVSAALGGVCMLISIAVYAVNYVDNYGTNRFYLGYSYYMGVCAMLLHVVGSVLIRFSVVGAAAGGVVMAPGGGVVFSANQGVVNQAGPV